MADKEDTRPNSKEFSLQGYGGMPKQTQGFSVKEHGVTNQPGSHDSWNPKTDNPLGPK